MNSPRTFEEFARLPSLDREMLFRTAVSVISYSTAESILTRPDALLVLDWAAILVGEAGPKGEPVLRNLVE